MIRRSGLEYCVSQGFSPHMKISFGPALSVGVISKSQIFDIYLKDYLAPEKVFKHLKDKSIDGIDVLKCEYLDNNLPAASASFGTSEYKVTIGQAIKDVKIPEFVIVHKKKGDKKLLVADYLSGDVSVDISDDLSILKFGLSSKESGSLKVDFFVQAILEESACQQAKIKEIIKL